jgi:hypothetical protein
MASPNHYKGVTTVFGFCPLLPPSHRELQLCCRPSHLKGGPRRLVWSPAANWAFRLLKGRFTSAPLLKHPDPTISFVVEVDASEVGVGAVLSQRQSNPQK